jgi:EmrB/QacA subfamily drug resistance transporter
MSRSKKVLAFISLAIACFLTVLDGTIVNVSLPTMAKYFGTDITGISWVSTAYLIPFSALLINFSKIADIFGRKKLFLIGLIIFGASSICCGLSTSLGMMISFRVLQGVGAAILTPLAIPLGIELFGKAAMGKLAIIVGMIISIAAASGPVVGGILNESFGFKAIFYVNTPFVVISLIFGGCYVKENYDKTIEKKVDFVGSILLALGLSTAVFTLIKGNDYGWGSVMIILLIVCAVVSLTVFVLFERKIKNPMIDINLFKVRTYTSSIILIAIIFFAYMPVSYLMNFYLESKLGYSVLKSGLMLGIVSAVAFCTAPIFGILAKITSSRVVSFLAITFACLANFMFVFMNSSNYLKLIYCAFIVLGLGLGATTPLYQSAFDEIAEDKNNMASGLLNSLRQLTACIAIALVATLSSQFTTTATTDAKKQIMERVNDSTVLEQNEKDMIADMVSKSNASDSASFSKNGIDKLMEQQTIEIMATIPANKKVAVADNLNKQKEEIYQIMDDAFKIKQDEGNKVYNKCYLITGIIAAFGFIAVPFNTKRKAVK